MAVVAVLILAGFVSVQQVATHSVVTGDTLWDLAQRYYQNPFEWRRIWEANRAQVADPNLIEPGWVLTIPGRDAQVSDVTVEGPPRPTGPAGPMRDLPTVFFQDTSVMRAGVVRSEQRGYVAVPRDLVYSAPWVVPLDQEPANLGTMNAFAGGASPSRTPRSWDRVHLVFAGDAPAPSTQLLTFRITRVMEGVGQVATPTGMLTVTEVDGQEAVAVLDKEFDLVRLGDLLAPVPGYGLRSGQTAQAVSDGPQAMIMGFADGAELKQLGAVAFLDLGETQGITVGDEFEYVNRLAGRHVVEGRLQVVGVTPNMAAARVVNLSDAVFRQGLVVHLARKMR
jgi:hypothetical protein